jgi:isoquinoline 1-oxidoreductase beta subunit
MLPPGLCLKASSAVSPCMSPSAVVAEIAEIVMKDGGELKVERVVCAVDCGVAINPVQVSPNGGGI